MATTFIIVRRGDTKKIPVTAYDTSGLPFNLAQVTGIKFTVKKKRSEPDSSALISKSLGSGIEVLNAANGTMMVTLNPADTSSMTSSLRGLVWDIQIVTSLGEVYTIADGLMNVERDVTRSI